MISGANAFELRLIKHPTGTVTRINLYSMVLILFSIILAAIAVAISVTRRHISFGSFTRSEIVRGNFPAARERSEQSPVAGPMNQFLIVVLPDGTIVTPRMEGEV
jgi:hypothetical protein